MSRLAALAVALLALGAFLLQLHVGLERRPDRAVEVELWRMLRYFTVQTTLLAALIFLSFTIRSPRGPGWAGGIALWSTIMGVVYHVLLSRDLSGLRMVADELLHTALPLAVVMWWLAFAPKRELAPRHALLWLIWPALYLAYALIRGEIEGRHPYFFVDPPRIGWPAVGLWVLGLGAFFWTMGRALVWLGPRLSRDRPHPEDAAPADPQPR